MNNVDAKKPHFAYMISPRDASVGGGWILKFFEQGLEVGGGAFAAPEGEDEAQVYLDAMDEGESWLLAKAEYATRDDAQRAKVVAAKSVVSEVEVQADEARLYRDLTGDVMALGFDSLVAAVETLRRHATIPFPRPTTGHPDLPLHIALQLVGDGKRFPLTWEARCNKSAGMFMDHKTPYAALSALLVGIGQEESSGRAGQAHQFMRVENGHLFLSRCNWIYPQASEDDAGPRDEVRYASLDYSTGDIILHFAPGASVDEKHAELMVNSLFSNATQKGGS